MIVGRITAAFSAAVMLAAGLFAAPFSSADRAGNAAAGIITASAESTSGGQTALAVPAVRASSELTSVTLTWNRIASADGYRIYIYRSGKWKKARDLNGSDSTSCTFSHLSPRTKYLFKVKAFARTKSGTVFGQASEKVRIYTKYSGELEAYAEFLKSESISWGSSIFSPEDLSFRTVDLNSDGVKELLLKNRSAGHIEGYIRIYTFRGGKVKLLTDKNGDAPLLDKFDVCYPRAGVVRLHNEGFGLSYYYYRIVNGKKLVPLGTFTVNNTLSGSTFYWGDITAGTGSYTTKKDFTDRLSKAAAGEEPKRITVFYKNNAANRKAKLGV